MKVECVVPEGAVLFRKLPTKKRELPQSKRVQGAFVHTFVLTSGKVNVIVRMHAKVQSRLRQSQLQNTDLWKVSVVEIANHAVDLLLTPAPAGARASISEITLRESGDRSFELHFGEYKPRALRHEPNLTHLERRLRLAQYEAQRV